MLTFEKQDGLQLHFEEEQRQYYWILPPDLHNPPDPANAQGFPLTEQYWPEVTINFTAAMQYFVFSLNRSGYDIVSEARDRKAFQGYIDTWNRFGKVRDHYNAILGEGNPGDLPKWEPSTGQGANVVCGRPVVSQGKGTHGTPAGTPMLRLETLDPYNLPMCISYLTHPHLIHHCCILLPNIYNARQRINPYPQMGARAGRPCYVPLMSPVPIYARMDHLVKVVKIPNPYWPAWVGFPKI